MDLVNIHRVLANETRMEILEWLKDPPAHFPPHREIGHFDDGVCVQYIAEKSGLSYSTVSHYLSMLQKIGLIVATRRGKWTYYKRHEKNITRYLKQLKASL